MKRVLRWLWRQCSKFLLVGMLLIGGAVFASMPQANFGKTGTPAPIPSFNFHTQSMNRFSSLSPNYRQNDERAKERARRGRLLFLASFLYEGILVFGFLLLGGTRWLAKLAARFGKHWVWALASVLAILSIAGGILTFPLDYYSGFTFQHEYGLSNQTSLQWLGDYLLSQGVGAVVGFPVAVLAYAILRWSPKKWWLGLTAASIPISIFLMLITPVFISPLFNKFTPIQDEALREDILAMAHSQGINAQDVYQMDASRQSNAVNAYVIGFGPTLRIVLYDTLLKEFTPEEIKYILAHEMGHYKLGHIYQGIVMSILGTLVGSYAFFLTSGWALKRFGEKLKLDSLGNPASYPLIMALGFVFSIIAMPIGNAFSRNMEWQADRYAAINYPHWDAGISSFQKLAKLNVAEEDPPRWAEVLLGTHPSLAERIKALEELKAGNPDPWPLPR